MCGLKWLPRVRLWHLFVCYAAGTVLLLRVRLGRPCALFHVSSREWTWMSSAVSAVANPKRKNAHNGKMRAATWEDPRYACHYQTADGGGLFAPGLYLLFSPPPLCSRLVLTAINEDQKIRPWREQVSRRTQQKPTRGIQRQHWFGQEAKLAAQNLSLDGAFVCTTLFDFDR